MTIPPRAVVAARVLMRDHPQISGPLTCTVRLEARVIETILGMAGRARFAGFQPTAYDSAPLAIHALPSWQVRRFRGFTKNKRLLAAIDLAIATASTISFALPETRTGRGSITVDCDITGLGWSDEAVDAATRYLRIEHADALNTLVSRGGQSLAHLDFGVEARFGVERDHDTPGQAFAAHYAALARLGAWASETVREADAADRAARTRGLRPGVRLLDSGRTARLDSDDIVDRLEIRADIRRNAAGRKSVEENKADRLAALLDEAAAEIRRLRAA